MKNPSRAVHTKNVDATEPVSGNARIGLLDALRGFAVCGILLVNLPFFMGFDYLTPPQQANLPWAAADKITLLLIHFLVEGKFYTIFSLLFGIGFAVQLLRVEEKGNPFLPLYLRRLSILLLIGLAHLVLLWTGDILLAYALTGFVLLLFRQNSNRVLLGWAAVLLWFPVVQYALVLATGGRYSRGCRSVWQHLFCGITWGLPTDGCCNYRAITAPW